MSDDEQYRTGIGDPELIFWFDAPNMITVDGDYHRRLRHAIMPMFTRTPVARWEKRVGRVLGAPHFFSPTRLRREVWRDRPKI